MMIAAPQPDRSPTRRAGFPPIITVVLPIGNGVGGCGGVTGNAQVCKSPTSAAGIPPMITVGQPGPLTIPP